MNKELFKAIRNNNGLTQEEYARRLNIAPSTVSKLERGEARVTDRIRIAVARNFPITREFLDTFEASEKLKSI